MKNKNNIISIHSLHTEGDKRRTLTRLELLHFNPLPPHGGRHRIDFLFHTAFTFQSTPSTRRETEGQRRVCEEFAISIHSLHTEGDVFRKPFFGVLDHFNPLPPHGGRLRAKSRWYVRTAFQSTPSTRRETEFGYCRYFGVIISIHSLHTEGDGTPV